MKIEEAIKMAISYEEKIRDLYAAALENIRDQAGRNLLQALKDDEQHHVDYLKSRLNLWQQTGELIIEELRSTIPSPESISREVNKLKDTMPKEDRGDEKQILSRALQVEVETSKFYQEMVDTLADEGRQLFKPFLAIEKGHIAIVQAELDYLSHTGYWFDFQEFDLEY
jgi:rubrerythrin